jgi:hypothetical protein
VECLALLAPTAEEVDLLRACLWQGPAAYDAWARWQHAVGDPIMAIQRDASGIKALLPLLHYGLRQAGGDTATSPVRHVLTAAYARETPRWQAYARISARVFAALTTASVPFLVVDGGALAVLAYPEPATRHSHGIDVLIETGDVERAAATLRAAGVIAASQVERSAAHPTRLVGPDQVPIALHTRLYRLPYYTTPMSELWKRAVQCEIADARVGTLSAADHLVFVCGQASCCGTRDALQWIADAWFLTQHRPDWSIVVRAAEASRLSLPLAVMLSVLADRFDAPVPSTVLDRLSAAAAAADRAARQIAIAGLRAGRRGRLRDLFRATSRWRGRFELAAALLAPSPTALKLGEPLRYPHAWPAYYVLRPTAYAARRLAKTSVPER